MKKTLGIIGIATLVGFIIVMFTCMFVDPDAPKSVELKETTGTVLSIEDGMVKGTHIAHVGTPYGEFTEYVYDDRVVNVGDKYNCVVEYKVFKDRIRLGSGSAMYEKIN